MFSDTVKLMRNTRHFSFLQKQKHNKLNTTKFNNENCNKINKYDTRNEIDNK